MKRYRVIKGEAESTMYLPDRCKGLSYGPERLRNIEGSASVANIVQRPWGMWEDFALNDECSVRILTCRPGQRLSDQRHKDRDEVFVILDLETIVEVDDEILEPLPGDYVLIPCHIWHRLICGGEKTVRVLEIAFGRYDQDNDIERRDDFYGRPLKGTSIGSR